MNEKPNKPDWNDLLALIGLLLLCVGIWWLSPPAALMTAGFIILLVSFLRSRGR